MNTTTTPAMTPELEYALNVVDSFKSERKLTSTTYTLNVMVHLEAELFPYQVKAMKAVLAAGPEVYEAKRPVPEWKTRNEYETKLAAKPITEHQMMLITAVHVSQFWTMDERDTIMAMDDKDIRLVVCYANTGAGAIKAMAKELGIKRKLVA